MNNNFYYLVPKGYNDLINPKNEYFIIRELIAKNLDITPIYNYTEIEEPCDGILFNSLKVILKNKKILTYANKYKVPIFWWYFDNAETKLTKSFKEGVIQPNGKKLKEATMDVNHVAETILNMLKLPLDTNILN